MSSRRFLSMAMPGLAVLLLASCVRLERERPEKKFFMIEAVRPPGATRSAPLVDSLLHVQRIAVSPAYESPSFVYRIEESVYESDYYNAFFVPPDAMMTDAVSRWMDGSGLFRRVESGGSQIRGEYLLEGNVRSLYGDYRSGGDGVIELQLSLLRDAPGGPVILHHGTYAARERIARPGPEGLVAAWSAGLSAVLGEAEADLGRVLAEPGDAASGDGGSGAPD